MSLRLDGTYRCDRCGVDVGNGGVHVAAVIVSVLDDGGLTTLHLCRDRTDDDKKVRGCAGRVLTARALADYHETRNP